MGRRKITDEMIGNADGVCSCSSVVGEIIEHVEIGEKRKSSLREIVKSLKKGHRESGKEEKGLHED
jgi:hypothetical protein